MQYSFHKMMMINKFSVICQYTFHDVNFTSVVLDLTINAFRMKPLNQKREAVHFFSEKSKTSDHISTRESQLSDIHSSHVYISCRSQ